VKVSQGVLAGRCYLRLELQVLLGGHLPLLGKVFSELLDLLVFVPNRELLLVKHVVQSFDGLIGGISHLLVLFLVSILVLGGVLLDYSLGTSTLCGVADTALLPLLELLDG
jgi:hypothetical protein